MKKTEKHVGLKIIALIILLAAAASGVFMTFGGFSLGKSANAEDIKAYAGDVSDIDIPDEVKVIALGEATHGNSEFQRLKKDVFEVLVENYGVRALALEADTGSCEKANAFIHGADMSAGDAAKALGFQIYDTREMAELLDYMRDYNERAADGEDLRLYGIDCQSFDDGFELLTEKCALLGIDLSPVTSCRDENGWIAEKFTASEMMDAFRAVKAELEKYPGEEIYANLAEALAQNVNLAEVYSYDTGLAIYSLSRDGYMKDNVLNILKLEENRGAKRIFLTAHNGHIAKFSGTGDMGALLTQELGDAYYTVGTDYYKTRCTLRMGAGQSFKRKTIYSHSLLGNGVHKAGLSEAFIDFAKLPDGSALKSEVESYGYMGSLGERYSILNRILPHSTRIFIAPAQAYNAVIVIAEPTPTEILS